MEPTNHPDQTPEEVSKLNQEVTPQQNIAENTIEETALPIENVVNVSETELNPDVIAEIQVETETTQIQVPAQPELISAPEVVSEAETTPKLVTPIEPEPTPESETIPVMEIESEAVEPLAKEVAEEAPKVETPKEIIAPVMVSAPVLTELPTLDLDIAGEVETVDEAIEDVVAVAEIIGFDFSHMNREQLVTLLEETVKNEDVNEIKTKISYIKVAYLDLTNKERQELYQKAATTEEVESAEPVQPIEVVDPLDERFKAAFAIYKRNKFIYAEGLEKQKNQNLIEKKKILEELKVLISSEETLKKTYDEFKALQDKWKGIGMVPVLESQGLWQNYHFLIEKFFDKVKINKELKELDLRKNLERKIELCEKAEELVLETSITKSFKRLQELHDEWKEVGPIAPDKRDEVWDRFTMASDKINGRRHDFYKKIQGDMEANKAAKELLIEKAEQIVAADYNDDLKLWRENAVLITELLKMWKSIGQASQKINNELWIRFKVQLDLFFNNKKDFYDKAKAQQQHNYNLKVDLCIQAESHKDSTDWKQSSFELIKLQEEWRKIGNIPHKHMDKIWKRFRSACDEFFTRKNNHFKNQESDQIGNLQLKEEIVKKLKEFEYSDDRQESLNKVKELQRVWMETGHVPMKEKDRIQAEFKAAVNKIYDKLKIDSQEASQMSYRSRFENVKGQPEAGRIISQERNGLQSKIDSLKEEIQLWENNIGFFAKSKQANLLKAEFEGKIARAKEELASLEAKAKILKNVAREQ